jgi:hypothetical protein
MENLFPAVGVVVIVTQQNIPESVCIEIRYNTFRCIFP